MGDGGTQAAATLQSIWTRFSLIEIPALLRVADGPMASSHRSGPQVAACRGDNMSLGWAA